MIDCWPPGAILVTMRLKRNIFAGVLVGTALLVGACGSDSGGPGDTPAPEGSPAAGGNPDHDPCLMGTWQLDVQDAADQVAALMSVPGADPPPTAEATGTVTIEFADALTVTHDNTVKTTMSLGGQDMVYTAVYSGSASSPQWTGKDGKLTGSLPEEAVAVDLTVTIAGNEMPVPEGIDIPSMALYAGDGTDLDYTCSGDSATITGPPPSPTWRLARA